MLWRDEIDLISITTTQNDYGDDIHTKSYRSVFANKKSVRQSEFYQAAQTGLLPQFMFEIREIDYNEEQSLRFNAKEYTIIRHYSKNNEICELICESLTNAGV